MMARKRINLRTQIKLRIRIKNRTFMMARKRIDLRTQIKMSTRIKNRTDLGTKNKDEDEEKNLDRKKIVADLEQDL